LRFRSQLVQIGEFGWRFKMTRLLVVTAVLALATAIIAEPAHAIKFYPGKNGTKITCTWQDCVDYCKQVGGSPNGCPSYCSKAITERKGSGECK
jgi:hypothetical protein